MRAALNNFDVRTRLAIAGCLSTTAVFIQHVYVLLFLMLASIILSALFSPSLNRALAAAKRLWYFFIIIVALQSIFTPSGKVIFEVGRFSLLTLGGMLKGTEFLLRITIIIFSAAIIGGANSRELVQGLIKLKIPFEIAFMVSVGIRFLPLLRKELADTLTAIQLRGLDLNKIRFKKRMRVYSYIFTPVLAGAIKKARTLSMAMETRAFRAYPFRTSYLTLKLMRKDYTAIIISFILTAAIFVSYFIFNFPGGII